MIGEIMTIYNRIYFKIQPFTFDLIFLHRITIVMGDSGTGKSYLFRMLRTLRMSAEYSKIVLFDENTDDFHEKLKKCEQKFVVIDNADIMLSDEDNRFINFGIGQNQYLIFGRNVTMLSAGSSSYMLLDNSNNQITLKKVIRF